MLCKIPQRSALLVRQHSSLWVASAAARELEIGDIVRANDTVEDLQDVFRYALPFTYELIISDEAVVVTTDETDCLEIW